MNPSPSPKRKRPRTEGPGLIQLPTETTSSIQDCNVNFPGDLGIACATRSTDTGTTMTIIPPDSNLSRTSSQVQVLTDIQQAAHLNRLALQKQMTEGKGTEDAYPRHIKNYETFWAQDQDRRVKENPNHQWIDAHPIIGEKVAIFLEHERTRAKVSILHQHS